MAPRDEDVMVVATNRKARHRFEIEETYEAGIELRGAEVKSLRERNCSIQEAYARPRGDELYLVGMHIAPYTQATIDAPEPERPRRLLLHRSEIGKIVSRCTQRGYTLVPLQVYFRGGWAKVRLGLARSRSQGDKRRKYREEEGRRDIQRALRQRRRRRS